MFCQWYEPKRGLQAVTGSSDYDVGISGSYCHPKISDTPIKCTEVTMMANTVHHLAAAALREHSCLVHCPIVPRAVPATGIYRVIDPWSVTPATNAYPSKAKTTTSCHRDNVPCSSFVS
jgi:hypothetical protein